MGAGKDEAGVALFLETAATLPPLTEKIPAGAAGAREFERLMHQLLLVYADRNRFAYTPVEDVGIDGLAQDGFPGLDGAVGFQFQWLWNDGQIKDALKRAGKSKAGLKHWILVTPRNLTPAEAGWAAELEESPGLWVRHWGEAEIEHLLRQCPALLARYRPQAARPLLDGYDGTDFGELTQSYRAKVEVAHARLRTIGLPPETLRERDSRADLRLRDLFIPLRLVPERVDATPSDLAGVLTAGSAVVLGDPGMGKSTLLGYLALLFSGGASLPGFSPPANTVPLCVSLRDFVRAQQTQPDLSFLAYLEMRARERLQLPSAHRAFFEAALRMGEAAVLLDGLDEVGSEAARHRVATQIRTFRAQFPACRFWITSRIYGYTSAIRLSGKEFPHYRIGHLDDDQVNGFIDRWYEAQLPEDPADGRARAALLRDAVHRTPSVRRLAGNPLLLTLMAFIHHGLRRLPQDRGALYEKCVEMLLKTWQDARRDDPAAPHALGDLKLSEHIQKDYLAHLALFIQEKNPSGKDDEVRGLVSRREALDCLTARHFQQVERSRPGVAEAEAREEMARFLDYVGDETGLLIDRGGDQLSFIHLSFQEYLAAWVYTCGTNTPRGASFFEQHIGDPAWEEVLLLRLYILLHGGGGTGELDAVVGALLRRLEGADPPRASIKLIHRHQAWVTLTRALRDDLDLRPGDQRAICERALGYWLKAPAFEGTWFAALDDVRRFADKSRETLRKVLAEAREREPLARALACLHLEATLFGFPQDAIEGLRRRADLPKMLPDLVAFMGQPGIDALLAEKATLADWSQALRALDGAVLYRRTLAWTFHPPAPAAVDAALALLWEKILADLRSRAAFASRPGSDAASLFNRPGRVISKTGTDLSWAVLPLSGARALAAPLPGNNVDLTAKLLCDRLARNSLNAPAWGDSWVELTSWTAGFIRDRLADFSAAEKLAPVAFRRIAESFSRNFGRAFVDDFDDAFSLAFGPGVDRGRVRFDRSFFDNNFAHTLDRDFVSTFVHNFSRASVRGLGHAVRVGAHNVTWEDEWLNVTNGDTSGLHPSKSDLDALAQKEEKLDPEGGATSLTCALKSPFALARTLTNVWSAAALHHIFTAGRSLAVLYQNGKVPRNAARTWLDRNPIEVYGVAFSWREYANRENGITGARRALLVAHAAYANLMTGLECTVGTLGGLDDPHCRVSNLLYELCQFRDEVANVRALEVALDAPELRPLLEATSFISVSDTDKIPKVTPSLSLSPSPPTKQPRNMPPLFSWLHLSDVHFGHPNVSHRWDQALVLDALRRDIAEHTSRGTPAPSALLVTGDIAFSGVEAQYTEARKWLVDLATLLKLDPSHIFLVPGNHDVDRSVDKSKRVARLRDNLREGREDLDAILDDPEERPTLLSRQAEYFRFAAGFPHLGSPDPSFWSHILPTPSGLSVRLIGLNTALLAADDLDKGKLRLGKQAIVKTLTGLPSGELVLILTHHPFREGWLADQREADTYIRGAGRVHLSGHVHEADSEEARSGAGTGVVRIAAGAVHGDKLPAGVPASHGYSFGAVVGAPDGSLRLRIWPRRWSESKKSFTVDVDVTPEERPFAEHPLPGLVVPAGAAGR